MNYEYHIINCLFLLAGIAANILIGIGKYQKKCGSGWSLKKWVKLNMAQTLLGILICFAAYGFIPELPPSLGFTRGHMPLFLMGLTMDYTVKFVTTMAKKPKEEKVEVEAEAE